ncbi:MAG: hypothetical protein A2901_00560 [Elusimicrobia bacterium RIFCSPLOWO2_01_FULL_54_10]|nr:MAG: hypothetical protein A2901_00560 [Elusimicrobia bacterium RIFCSPLOWO2_01_FULL_54_10]
MVKKRKEMRIRCDCGGYFKEQLHEIDGLEVEAMVCPKCGYVTLTKKQAKFMLELRKMTDALGVGRRVIRIGNTCGVTFPPILVHPGQPVEIRPISPNKYIVSFGK